MAEVKLTKRSSAYLQGRRDAFEAAASVLRDSMDIAKGLGPLIATMDMYANPTIQTMNRRMDEELSDPNFGIEGTAEDKAEIYANYRKPEIDLDFPNTLQYCREVDSANRALSFDGKLNKIAPILDGTPNAHALAEKIITALFGERL